MSNVYYHRLNPENFYGLDKVSNIQGYAKRALITAKRDDFVLLDKYDGLVYPPPEIELLNKIGVGPKPENILVVDFDSQKSWPENYFNNKDIIEKIRSANVEKLLPFTGQSPLVFLLAQSLGVLTESSPAELCRWGEDTATLLELGHALGNKTKVPHGFACETDKEIIEAWKKIQNDPDFAGYAVIKNRHSASGLLSSVVRSDKDVKHFLKDAQMEKYGGATVEVWYENDIRSPSINYFIRKDGSLKEMFISDQIFEEREPEYGFEGTRIYVGNFSPSTFGKKIHDEIRAITRPLITEMQKRGYWGAVGFDCIVLPDNSVMVAEINSRITGPHYAFRPAEHFGCTHFRIKNEENLKLDVDIKKLENVLQKEDLLMVQGRDAGYIPFNFYTGQKFTGVAVAKTKEKLNEFLEKLDPVLSELKK